MVKLGNNFSEKNNGKVVSEDGFDTIPLITPLDASQLQFPPPDKVVVKTKADYDGEGKKGKLRSPKIAEFSISIIEGVSERLKVTLLVICALAFLVCVVFLVVYKVYQYEQPCPDSFVYTAAVCLLGCMAATPLRVLGAADASSPSSTTTTSPSRPSLVQCLRG
ncbi:neuronal vesicle trafficking-associated protein 1-like isoform X2 [Cheilinus undulatus]|uniref:neuronal vesicle trafficking-associated protein 1-like isoform X2 n=1 Tax=Cheilinus undulatus TaxID=241271 RepID=UPI001BD4F1B6|nr:neuronal vesicle trafficking-associated protein 1-like isoform X2 [Cheilinus undulatus]